MEKFNLQANQETMPMTTEDLRQLSEQLAEKIIFTIKEVLTAQEAARYMGISMSYLYKLTMRKQIPHYKPMGKVCYFQRQEIEQWLLSNKVSTDDELSNIAMTYCSSEKPITTRQRKELKKKEAEIRRRVLDDLNKADTGECCNREI